MWPAMLFENFGMFNIYVPKCLEKRCREINEPKLNDTLCGFHPAHNTTDKNFTLQKSFEKSWSMPKTFTHVLSTSWKPFGSVPGVGYDVDGRLLLTVKSLYSCSNVCVHVGRNKSPPFAVGIGLRHWLVLSPLLFSLHQESQTTARGPPPARRPVQSDPPNTLRIFFKCHVSDCGQQCNSINFCL